MSISHHLLAKCPLSAVKKIYSHRNALAECSIFLQGLSPEVERIVVPSTAVGAERALSEPGSAAIGSNLAAELLGEGMIVRRSRAEEEDREGGQRKRKKDKCHHPVARAH